MNIPNALNGWIWVKQGFAIFRRQPAEMISLFFAYMFFNLIAGMIPVIGQMLPLLFVPLFAMSFMQACRQTELGQRIYPILLIHSFKSPVLPELLKLGVLYVLAAVLAVASSSWIDDGVFWDFIMSQKPIDPKTLPETGIFWSMIFSAIMYTPALMGFWYAAPLITWNKMGVTKAVFYSFFAFKRAGKAFLVYGLAWVAIGVLCPLLISLVIAFIIGNAMALMLILMPVSMVLTVIMYCSFYPTYTDVFGVYDEQKQINSD